MVTGAMWCWPSPTAAKAANSPPSCPCSSAWAPPIALTGGLQSTLAKHADLVLDCSVEREARPLNLAPTASTTAQLAMGDAWPWPCSTPGLPPEDFARSHPGGSLGRKLLTHVSDVMQWRSGARVGPKPASAT